MDSDNFEKKIILTLFRELKFGDTGLYKNHWRQLRGQGGRRPPPQDFQNDIFLKILLVLLIQCSICTRISRFSTF